MGYEDIRQQAGVGDGGIKDPLDGSSWNPFNDHMGDLKDIIEATKPEPVDKAGNAFSSCASNMEHTAELLYEAAKRLSDNWQGDASDAALKKLKEMYTACQEIHEAAQPSGAALEAQAGVLRKYKQIVGAAGGPNAAKITTAFVALQTGTIVPAAAANQIFNNRHAKQLMQDLNEDTRASNNHFPMHMRTDVPMGTQVVEPRIDNGETPPGAGKFPKGSMPNGPGADFPRTGGPGSHPSMADFPGGSDPNGEFPGGSSVPGQFGTDFPGSSGVGAGTDLAGFNPSVGGGGAGGGLGAGAGGVGAFDPAGPAGGAGLNAGVGGPGSVGRLAGGAGAVSGKGASGRGMMPMAPHAGGQGEEKERERSTWLTEDEDVWSAGDDAAPPVIG